MNALISRENSRGIILHRVLRENIFRFKKSRQNIDGHFFCFSILKRIFLFFLFGGAQGLRSSQN